MMRPRLRLIQWLGIILLLGWNLMNTHCSLKPELVTVDKTAVVARFVRQMSQLTLTDAELTANTMRFGQALTGALNDYSMTHQSIILDASTVLAGRRDVTPDILRLVATRMQSFR